MSDERREIEEAVATLADDPRLTRFVGPQTPVLVFDVAGERLLWASRAASALARAVAGEDGQLSASPFAGRVRALAGGLAPREGMRLERLRLPIGRMASLVTCACRRLSLASGEEALLIAIADSPAFAATEAAPSQEEESRPGVSAIGEAKPAERVREAAPPRAAPRRQGTIRFLWHADAEGRFNSVSDGLASVVGRNAEVTGRRWDELVGAVVEDPGGAVSRAFAAGETWAGRTIEWRIAESDLAVPIDFAGMPVRGRDGRIVGFRGFGLCRTDEMVEMAPAEEREPDVEPSESSPPEPEQHPEPAAESTGGPASSFPDIGGSVTGRLGEPRIPLRLADGGAARSASSEGQPERAVAAQPRPAPRLSFTERSAFREIARALGARFDDDEPEEAAREDIGRAVVTPLRPAPPVEGDAARVLDRLPVGILIHRGDDPLFANRLLLDLIAYDDIGQLADEGGVPRLFRGRAGPLAGFDETAPLALTTRANESVPVEVRLTTVEWDGLPASLMLIRRAPEAEQGQRLRALELELRAREGRLRELSSILDTATDGVLVLDDQGRILSLNRSAEALFGYDQKEVVGERFIVLLAPESHGAALDYLEGLRANGVASLLNDGRQVLGRVRQGGTIPLFMTIGRVAESPERKFCAVLRDITAFKKTEGELLSAKRAAEEGSAQKSDFLAKVSHEIRTPLNAIIGFAEVMLEERFGPIGNERYKDYLSDIHASGGHVISLVNDLLDLAKVEAGRMELAFTSVKLNDIVAACVALMQPEAARERIVMRTSFARKLPAVVADERSMRQIVLNIIANAIRFTEAGGQVIVSTALTDRGEVGIRVRDTGVGMSAEDVAAALEPFRQLATTRRGGGTGLGLPLTKALVEANRGTLRITSARNEGTLVEVLFPPTRVLAD